MEDIYRNAGIDSQVSPFISDMAQALAQAHLVIARAGGSTVAEIAASGRPAIFIPYPHHADRQQFKNAQELVNTKAAQIIEESQFTCEHARTMIEHYMNNPEILSSMAAASRSCGRPDAAGVLADAVEFALAQNLG